MLEELRKQVYEANMQLQKYDLVKLTWGNVSGIDRESGLVVIKPSGVPYEELSPENMVIVNLNGDIVEGELNPSTDTPTHLALYQAFDQIGGITHTHSKYATIWAQAGLDVPAFGTTHADYFYGDVPCTLPMEDEQINGEYEKQTGFHIADTFASRRIEPMDIPACLVASHGPFTWGKTPAKSVENSLVLEVVAEMALHNMNAFEFGLTHIQQTLLDKHFLRKHGAGAYYGQDGGARVTEVTSSEEEQKSIEEEVIEIKPSSRTVELQNIYEISDAVKPEPEPEMPQFMRIPGTAPAEVPFNSMPSVGGSAAPAAPQANAPIPPMPKPPAPAPQANAGIPPMPRPAAPQADEPVPPMPKPPAPAAPQQPAAPKGPMNFTF